MKLSMLGLLLASASCQAFIIDESCKTDSGNLELRLKKSVKEAKLALANAARVAEQCQVDCEQEEVDNQLLSEVKQWCGDGGDLQRRKESNSLLVKFLGDESADTWNKIYSATSKAKDTLGTSTDQSDNAKIYCGDSSFIREAGQWRDKNDEYKRIAWDADRGSAQRPCEKPLIGLAIHQKGATQKGILICNYKDLLSDDTNPKVAGSYFSANNLVSNIDSFPIDVLGSQLSSALLHEMIHLGDMDQFPLVIDKKSGKHEQYGYSQCEKLAGQDASWHNCDTFAMITRALYMNTYYSDNELLKRLPDDQQPPATEVNAPNGFKAKS